MNQLIRYWKGYVRLRMGGRMPERFLNLCAANQIFLWNLVYEENGYLLTMAIRDFRKIQPLCRKTGCTLHIVEKHGMPFFFYHNRKRKGFFIGIFFFFGLLYLLSCFIWNIHVDGNYANSTFTILAYLEQQGVHHGVWKNKIVCQDISAKVREAFPDITWVSTKIQGTQLIVEVKENVDGYQEKEEEPEDETPCNLTAGKKGTVVSIITRKGIPQVAEGTVCEEGDLLVSGEIPIINDSGETIRYEYVHADSDIYLQTHYYYYKEFKRNYIHREYAKETHSIPFFEAGSYRLNLDFLQNKDEMTVSYEDRHQLYLTENFALPVFFGTITSRAYTEEERVYTEEECQEIAGHQLSQYTEDLKKMGVQISENNVKIEITDTSCIAKGELLVIEQADVEVPCQTQEAPGKDNSLDEQ